MVNSIIGVNEPLYKLFDKNSVKTERIVDQISYNAGDFLKILIIKIKKWLDHEK